MKKRHIIAISILAVLIVLGIVAAVMNRNKVKETASSNVEVITSVTIPELALYCGDQQIASLNGYIMSMEEGYMRDNLAVIENGSVHARISTNGATVEGISYRIRSIDGEELLDDNSVKEFEENDGIIDLDISITSIAASGEEYILTIILETAEQEAIYYYSRITEPEENLIEDQAEFALEFDGMTFMHEEAADLYYYLESDSSFDNTNLGYVTINSNFDQLTWGSLDPEQVADPEIELKEINVLEAGSAATFEITYKIKTGDEGEETYYNVKEDITVWTYYSDMHVLAYERTVEEIFNASSDTITSNRVYLGIHEDTDLDYIQDDDGTYLVFASGDSLWSINTSSNVVNKIYTTGQENTAESHIEAISVDENGNIEFAVIGYETEGAHAGKSGIGVYTYNSEDDEVTENVFIPYDKPYQVLKEEIGDLYHIDDGILYIMLNDTVQYVNMSTKEYGVVADGLLSGNYTINSSQNVIAYNTDKSIYESDSITILNLDTMSEYVIEAGENKKIRVLGYSGDNLVYGIAKESKITTDEDGNTTFAMSKVIILNSDNEEIKSYSKKKVYITDVEISTDMINLKRVKGGEEISDDQLLDNTEKITAVVEVSYLIDDTKKRIMVLVFNTSLSSTTEMTFKETGSCETKAANELNIEFTQPETEKYYVYGFGELKGISTNLSEAEELAQKVSGTVVNDSGEKVWVFEEHYNDISS